MNQLLPISFTHYKCYTINVKYHRAVPAYFVMKIYACFVLLASLLILSTEATNSACYWTNCFPIHVSDMCKNGFTLKNFQLCEGRRFQRREFCCPT
ncbi:hypothetical protein QR680_014463 [Steinernema hermaphroditum]|uniref:Uncharacterized protein n=1 Tax=Steinernema hermaphroditum TaxID=289476 RepID=A0AA39M3Y5_9BILA|nr:hypothetical protein QR680_014463 [Steinernema hermaphroditum]